MISSTPSTDSNTGTRLLTTYIPRPACPTLCSGTPSSLSLLLLADTSNLPSCPPSFPIPSPYPLPPFVHDPTPYVPMLSISLSPFWCSPSHPSRFQLAHPLIALPTFLIRCAAFLILFPYNLHIELLCSILCANIHFILFGPMMFPCNLISIL